MYIKRHLEEQVKSASKSYPVVMVCGQRQVGKSTMLYHIKESERKYITLDDRNAKLLAEKDPALFLENYGTPLLIDEIQRAPGLLLEIKRFVDERALKGEDCGGLFWLTGSQRFRMMKGVSETLSGRIAVFEMAGLSAREIDGRERVSFLPISRILKYRLRARLPRTLRKRLRTFSSAQCLNLSASMLTGNAIIRTMSTLILKEISAIWLRLGIWTAFMSSSSIWPPGQPSS